MGKNYNSSRLVNGLSVDASGNVGVGGSPSGSYKFEVTGASKMSGFLGVNGSPATSFPFESYINSSTAYSSTSRGNVMRVYNSNTGANVFAGIELGGAGTANDGLAGINGIVTGSGSAALSFYTRNGGTFSEKVRFAADGNSGFGTGSDIVSTNLTGALTIKKSYNGDSTNGATTQSYYANQSALFLFGRNSGVSIISNNNEEGSIIFGNNSTNAYASIVTGSGGSATGGDMYFKVGSNTERMRIRTNGNKTFNGPGGQDQMFSNIARTSNGEYIDIDTESGGGNFMGILIAQNSYAYNAGYRTQCIYAIVGRGTTISVTTITSVNGPTGSSAISITSPSTGIIRITNVGLYGDTSASWRGFV
jgi:hypothetical protein